MDNFLTLRVKKSKTIRIECRLFSPDKTKDHNIILIYDTGADKTSITRTALNKLAYSEFAPSNTEKRTASGIIRPDTCTISELIIGNQFRLSEMEIDVLEIESSPTFDGLIGMDFITQMENVLSGQRGTLTISGSI